MTPRGPYKSRPEPGSFAELIHEFRQSPRYRGWSPHTRARSDHILHDFITMHGRQQVSSLTRGLVLRMRDMLADTPEAANHWLKAIRILLAFAVDREYIPHSPADKVPSLRPKAPGGFRFWFEHEIDAFFAHHPLGSLPHRVVTLALCTAAARIDLVKLGWANVQRGSVLSGDGGRPEHSGADRVHLGVGRIRYQRAKTRMHEDQVWIDLPIMPALAELLDTIPRSQMTFLETRDGAVRSELSLTNDMPRWVKAAGLGAVDENGRHLNMHGLRKAVGRRLAEAGCSPHEIMAIMGHRNISSSEPYTRAYNRARSADGAVEKMAGAKPSNVTKLRRTE